MKKSIVLDSPARIHLGFLEMNDEAQRIFGSIGLTISKFIKSLTIFEIIKSLDFFLVRLNFSKNKKPGKSEVFRSFFDQNILISNP